MRIPIRWLSLAIAVLFLVGLAADADGKQRKRRKKRKKRATIEQPVTPPAAPQTPPEEPGPEPPAAEAATEESKGTAPAESLPAPATEAAVVEGVQDVGAGETEPPDAESPEPAAVDPVAAVAEPETTAAADDVETIEATEVRDVPAGESIGVTHTETSGADGPRAELSPITGGVELAVAFPDPLANLGSGFSIAAEVGYLLPFWDQRLEIFVDFVYVGSQMINRDILDPRVPGGVYRYSITEQEFQFHVGALARLYPPGEFLNFYGQLGVGAHFQMAEAGGKAGPPGVTGTGFLLTQDNSTAFSVYVAPGVELMLGPGAVAAELGIDFSHLNQTVAGGVAAVRFGFRLGYHVLF